MFRPAPIRLLTAASRMTSPTKRKRAEAKEPAGWQAIYEKIRAQRSVTPAPVDTMGCERLADTSEPPNIVRYQHLVALMLSSQTKDQVTAAAMMRLRQYGLTIAHMLAIPESDLADMLRPVGFFNRKAIYVKQVAVILHEKYNDDIPPTLEELMALPGVGPKMANLCMQVAWNKTEGIGVDVHVHRISNRLRWVKTTTPEETREALQDWLPRSYWRDINVQLVGFGQTICQPVRPRCESCDVNQLCPSSTVRRRGVKKEEVLEAAAEGALAGEPLIKLEIGADEHVGAIKEEPVAVRSMLARVKRETRTVKKEVKDAV